jgi:hypothetical protein
MSTLRRVAAAAIVTATMAAVGFVTSGVAAATGFMTHN